MKITPVQDEQVQVQKPKEIVVDIMEIFFDLQEKHRNVFTIKIDNEIFIYRSLGRAEYKKILQEEDLSDLEKQDIICDICLLWPEDYDLENCFAGVPDILYKKILENSFLDSVESRKNVLTYYRDEMFDLDNQITCIISEAFPQFDIEEIEKWDIEKTTKYLSRAEWKLHNLRGLSFVDNGEQVESFYDKTSPPVPEPAVQQAAQPAPKKEETRRGNSPANKLTPEKIAEMKALQAKFPEINFFGDTILNEGESAMMDSVDVVAPALRPGGR